MKPSEKTKPSPDPAEQSQAATPPKAPESNASQNTESSLGRSTIEPIELEDLLAQRVAEKAKTKVIAYFGLLGILVSVILAIWGAEKVRSGIDSAVGARMTNQVDIAISNAQARISMLSRDFEKQLSQLQRNAQTRSSAFEELIGAATVSIQRSRSNSVSAVEVDISSFIGPILDGGQSSGVVAFACIYAIRAELKTLGQPFQDISPFAIYYGARKAEGTEDNLQVGMSMTGTIKGLRSMGAYALRDWPTEAQRAPQKDARPLCTISSFKQLDPLRAADIIRYLQERHPVVISVTVYEEDYANQGGLLTVGTNIIGGHAVCVVGYSEGKQLFTVANSWTTNWGDKGFGYIAKKDLDKLCQSGFVLTVKPQ